jgi:hypothetical protein
MKTMEGSMSEAQNLRIRAQSKIDTQMMREINSIMKSDHTVICALHSLAKSLVKGDVASEGQAPAADKPKAIESDDIPDGSYCFNYWSVTWLQRLCADLEPVALCVYQTKKLVERGHRDKNKIRLLEMIELMTGKSPSMQHETKSYQVLLDECAVLNNERGRRMQDVKLPADWAKVGPYIVLEEKGHVWLKHRFQPLSTFNPVNLSIQFDKKLKKGSFTIQDNFSDFRAVLRYPGAPRDGILCRTFFPTIIGSKTDIKRKAIEDGNGEEPLESEQEAETIVEPPFVESQSVASPLKKQPPLGAKIGKRITKKSVGVVHGAEVENIERHLKKIPPTLSGAATGVGVALEAGAKAAKFDEVEVEIFSATSSSSSSSVVVAGAKRLKLLEFGFAPQRAK